MGRSCIDLYSNDVGAPFVDVTSFGAYVGGCPTNISVGTRRLGLNSALLTLSARSDRRLRLNFSKQGAETPIPRKVGRRTSAVLFD
jgi:5-dehydro-2-deoxygluconokinase